jgi:hypothetical protein
MELWDFDGCCQVERDNELFTLVPTLRVGTHVPTLRVAGDSDDPQPLSHL